MIRAHALSWVQFCATMQEAGLDDTNIETKTPLSGVIEIMGEQDLPYMPFHFKEDHKNVLRLIFDDVDKDMEVVYLGEREPRNLYTMSEEQGKKLFEFIKVNNNAINFVVHCAAGVSRSGAVAKFIMEYTGGEEDRDFYVLNPNTRPNGTVLRILRNLAQTKPDDNAANRGDKETSSD